MRCCVAADVPGQIVPQCNRTASMSALGNKTVLVLDTDSSGKFRSRLLMSKGADPEGDQYKGLSAAPLPRVLDKTGDLSKLHSAAAKAMKDRIVEYLQDAQDDDVVMDIDEGLMENKLGEYVREHSGSGKTTTRYFD